MGKRRNSERRPDGIVTLPIRRAEPPVRPDGRPGALVFPAPGIPLAGGRRLVKMEGPLPLPETLREYDEMVPGLAARIVEWAEREAEHRRRMERSLPRLSWGGLWCALAVALVAILGGMVLAWRGRSTVGLAGILATLAGLVIVFLAGRRRLPGVDTAPQGVSAIPAVRRMDEPPA